ncbi:hypothetical protein [Candidatus Chlorohelix sp.]
MVLIRIPRSGDRWAWLDAPSFGGAILMGDGGNGETANKKASGLA